MDAMRKPCALGVALLLFTLCSSVAFAGPGLKIVTENLPPFNIAAGGDEAAPSGISTDTLVAIFDKIGQPIDPATIEVMPWARAYQTAQTEPSTLLYSTVRTEERESLFQWVGPIEQLTIGVIAMKDRKIVINDVKELEQYTIGTIRNGAPEQLLKKAGVSDAKFDPISDSGHNLKKLLSGRIDLFAFLVPTTQYLLIKEGQNPRAIEVVYSLKEADLYYAFPKQSDPAMIQALQTALESLKKPGPEGKSEFDAIVEKYMGGI
jgi:polar amino acid transport system substrate-binding protein